MKRIITLVFLFVCIDFFGQVGFQNHTIINQYYGDVQPRATAAADFDGDGTIDVAVAGFHRIMYHKNLDGQGSFSIGQPIFEKDSFHRIIAADIDGDNDVDIIGIRWGSELYMVKNNGNGTFAPGVKLRDVNSYTMAIQVADIDNDNDLDVAYNEYPSMRWL